MLKKFFGVVFDRDRLRLSAEYNVEDIINFEDGFRSYTPEAVMSRIFEFSENNDSLSTSGSRFRHD